MLPLSNLPGLWDDTVDSAEAMRRLNCGRTKLYALIAARELPAERIGRGYTIPTKAISEYLARRAARRANPVAV